MHFVAACVKLPLLHVSIIHSVSCFTMLIDNATLILDLKSVLKEIAGKERFLFPPRLKIHFVNIPWISLAFLIYENHSLSLEVV